MGTDRNVELLAEIEAQFSSHADSIQLHQIADRILARIQLKAGRTNSSILRAASIRRFAKKLSKQFELEVSIVLSAGERLAELEKSLIAILVLRFPGMIADVVIAGLDFGDVDVWVVPVSYDLDQSTMQVEEIVDVCKAFISLTNLRPGEITVVGYDAPQPSLAVIVRHLKIQQPVGLIGLADQLQGEGFRIPSQRWLQSQLDQLRQKGLICVAGKDKLTKHLVFALTETGLASLRRQVGRNSSDILRALAFRGRKW